LRQTACEDVVLNFCIEGRPGYALLLKVDRHIARFPAPQNRIDRFIERTHAVVALRTRTVEPVGGSVTPGNQAVDTRGDVDNDFAPAAHGGQTEVKS
jgi:hypothetical protein